MTTRPLPARPPTWKIREGQEEDDFDAIWLYEHAWEWQIKVEADGLVICRYLSSEIMPIGKTYVKEQQEHMTKRQVPPRHPQTGQFVARKDVSKVNKGPTKASKPDTRQAAGKASMKEGKE